MAASRTLLTALAAGAVGLSAIAATVPASASGTTLTPNDKIRIGVLLNYKPFQAAHAFTLDICHKGSGPKHPWAPFFSIGTVTKVQNRTLPLLGPGVNVTINERYGTHGKTWSLHVTNRAFLTLSNWTNPAGPFTTGRLPSQVVHVNDAIGVEGCQVGATPIATILMDNGHS